MIRKLFSSRSFGGNTVLLIAIVPLSVLLQGIAVGHIIFYKLKFRYLDTRVHTIQINQRNNNDVQNEDSNNKDAPKTQLNTEPYNEIIFSIGTIITWLFVFIFCHVIIYNLKSFSDQNYRFIHYANDFIPLFITNIILPCTFFATSHKSRIFIKQLFVRK